jgi:hypothetical protein|tara:strand:- start:340 stop:552 length:213 start_codon:yes stop_codon:yes gene_type:complete
MTITEERLKNYRQLAECIKSDQVSARQMVLEFEADPEFKDWYFTNFVGKRDSIFKDRILEKRRTENGIKE